jgi:hypothetical protein
MPLPLRRQRFKISKGDAPIVGWRQDISKNVWRTSARPDRCRQCSNLFGRGSTRRVIIGSKMAMPRALCKRDCRARLHASPHPGISEMAMRSSTFFLLWGSDATNGMGNLEEEIRWSIRISRSFTRRYQRSTGNIT